MHEASNSHVGQIPGPPTYVLQVATDSISVHAHELVLSSATFTPSEGSSASSAESITLKTKSKMAVVGFEEVLPVGKGILEIKFRGTLNDPGQIRRAELSLLAAVGCVCVFRVLVSFRPCISLAKTVGFQ